MINQEPSTGPGDRASNRRNPAGQGRNLAPGAQPWVFSCNQADSRFPVSACALPPSRRHLVSVLLAVRGVILVLAGEVGMLGFAWVAGVTAVVVRLITVTDLWGARRFDRALLRKPARDPAGHARRQARGSSLPNSFEATTGLGSRPVRRRSTALALPSHADSTAGVCVFVTPAKPVPGPRLAAEVGWTVTRQRFADSDFVWGSPMPRSRG
jgi:hypothetical protein